MTEGERIVARRESKLQGRVLLVDDEGALDFEREVLCAAGLDVVTANCRDKAVDLLKQQSFDMLLLDSKAPGQLSSEGFFQWLREAQPQTATRTILMLPPTNDSSPRSFVNSEHVLCFMKPFEASELLMVLRRVLRATKAAVGN